MDACYEQENDIYFPFISKTFILDLLYGFVTDSNVICDATDVAYWRMKAVTEDGMKYDVSGPVTNWVEHNGENISNLIRASVPIDDLIVFGEDDEEGESVINESL